MVRKMIEKREKEMLSNYAALSVNARRAAEEEACPFRTAIQRDRDRIIHSKAFRRLKHKTQVFVAPTGDHYRTRLTHTLEVSQISRTISRALRLNEDLVEAIALGHDVGHAPFGHAGENAFRKIIGHYNHNEQSLRVVEVLEQEGKGLNLTNYVKDGILKHTGKETPMTLEGQIVKIGDRIAYLCHDLDDSLRAGLLKVDELPRPISKVLGNIPRKMIEVMVSDMITTSIGKSAIKMSDEVSEAMTTFRNFMFERVYESKELEEERREAEDIIIKLYLYFIKKPEALPQEFAKRIEAWGHEQIAIDYVAGLTDQFAIKLFADLYGVEAAPKKYWSNLMLNQPF
ncbi:MAG: deoxyguanosinetriphosphate triphosphohydrolase [Bacillota bacterium]|nr:deoxyguanosinetriphosphate triphosphohydrolase [Bacillota bacterium]